MKSELLNLSQLATVLPAGYSTVRRYAEARGLSELMGGLRLEGELGVRFPVASLDRWRSLISLHNANAITPKTAAAALPLIWGATLPNSPPSPGCDNEHGALERNPSTDMNTVPSEIRMVKSCLSLLIAQALTDLDLTQDQVAERTPLTQADVWDVVRGRTSRLSLEQLIQALSALGRNVQIVVRDAP